MPKVNAESLTNKSFDNKSSIDNSNLDKIINTNVVNNQANKNMVQKLSKSYLINRDLQKDEFLGLTTICKSEGNKYVF